ncbi:MAG: helix-turn-helix domain-containing protein [Pirellulales bacterium]|nr:helix-turn-helix domain-containing protein [Pirellulales bacterium]
MNSVSAAPVPLLVDTPTAARMLGVSARTVWTLANCGELRPTRIGRAVRFSVAELERFIAEREAFSSDSAK